MAGGGQVDRRPPSAFHQRGGLYDGVGSGSGVPGPHGRGASLVVQLHPREAGVAPGGGELARRRPRATGGTAGDLDALPPADVAGPDGRGVSGAVVIEGGAEGDVSGCREGNRRTPGASGRAGRGLDRVEGATGVAVPHGGGVPRVIDGQGRASHVRSDRGQGVRGGPRPARGAGRGLDESLRAVGRLPHRDGVASRIDGDLGVVRGGSRGQRDGLAPAAVRRPDRGLDDVPPTLVDRPDRVRRAARVHGDVGVGGRQSRV